MWFFVLVSFVYIIHRQTTKLCVLFHRWELYHLLDGVNELIPETFWSNFSTTGSNLPAVTFLPGVFQEGEIYIIIMYSSWGSDFHRKGEMMQRFKVMNLFPHTPCNPLRKVALYLFKSVYLLNIFTEVYESVEHMCNKKSGKLSFLHQMS